MSLATQASVVSLDGLAHLEHQAYRVTQDSPERVVSLDGLAHLVSLGGLAHLVSQVTQASLATQASLVIQASADTQASVVYQVTRVSQDIQEQAESRDRQQPSMPHQL